MKLLTLESIANKQLPFVGIPQMSSRNAWKSYFRSIWNGIRHGDFT